ncbi:MAG TPA: TIGR04283 family arsenosugar biosynthesis glycosyltransferase [Acidobacteriota bacterium]|nr:TIGR04283 family arsenosugar biosynthesis glycosyltransferase [Acidobacteriota bacterium]
MASIGILGASTGKTPSISVIIPALNEAGRIGEVLDHVLTEPGVEAIVADGGSRDDTRLIAHERGARVVSSPAGRGQQMNIGAAIASGEILVFLHADTILPGGYAGVIKEILADSRVVAGAFTFRLDLSTPLLRLTEIGANLRSRWLSLPFGDQALFLRARTFRQTGGFQSYPIMEDVEFVCRLRKLGKIRIANEAIVTSARLWQQVGPLKVMTLHAFALTAYQLGFSVERIHMLLRWGGYFNRNGNQPLVGRTV